MIDHADTELHTLDTVPARSARGQPGRKALMGRYGIGWLTEVASWAEFGDVRRFTGSRQAVRFTGLDVTITASDGKRAAGTWPARAPRGCAGRCTRRPCAPPATSPDHADYLAVKQRLGGKRAALSVARQLAREAYHTWVRSATRRSCQLSSSPPPHELVDDRARSGRPIVAVVRPAP
jgi:transposase